MHDELVLNGKQILVVEDHTESLEFLQLILEEEGYRVQSAQTGRDALNTVAPATADTLPSRPPDLILLDLRLPDMNGVEVVREMRENLPAPPPVVLLSSDPPHVLNAAADSIGVTAVRKPFDFDELFQVIKRTIAKTAPA